MLDYDFAKLNDKEFEAFSVDLLSQHLGIRIERFKAGKDAGIDGRYFAKPGSPVILQCKHWIKTGIDGLLRHLKVIEVLKVAKLKPARYILAISLPLSKKNKDDILDALSPWIKETSDIYGQEDLNDILGNHPQVEERHYKLWLASVSIMTRMQNASIKGRSEFKIAEAQAFAPKYVVTAAHSEAIDKLEKLGSIIITGEPGIGKSTLAEQIALQYALKGFEICCVAENIDEAERVWQKSVPQVFYFDDFLGRNYLMALGRHEDSHVVGFIKRIKNDGSKRFILTSRTTVLNQGKTLTDLFKIENLNRNEFELRVERLSLIDKARMLYNHVWNSELAKNYIDVFYEDARYLRIAQHRNFNPRLIGFVTDFQKVSGIDVTEYWQYIFETLQNPKDIWAHVFESQLSVAARTIVRLVVLTGKDISETALKNAYVRYAHSEGESEPLERFTAALSLAVGAVLNRTLAEKGASLSLFNPSLGDFVVNRYKDTPDELRSCLLALQSSESLLNLSALKHGKILNQEVFAEVLCELVITFLNDQAIDIQYRIRLARLCIREGVAGRVSKSLESFILQLNHDLTDTTLAGEQAEILFFGITEAVLEGRHEQITVKLRSLLESDPDEEEFRSLSAVIDFVQTEDKDDVIGYFVDTYVESWRSNIREFITNDGVLDDFSDPDQSDKAMEKLEEYVYRNIDELHVAIPKRQIDQILEACDVDAVLQRNMERTWGRYEGPSSSGSTGSLANVEIAEVHDLFERS